MQFIFLIAVVLVPYSSTQYNPSLNSDFERDLHSWSEAADPLNPLADFQETAKSKEFPVEVLPSDRHDSNNSVPMGASDDCDDGKTNLEVDWDGSAVNYTCYDPGYKIPTDETLQPLQECYFVGNDYMPKHICMDEKIEYDSPYPTYADHRPVWAKYGEYDFLPPQRWTHNIEHGGVVMLYHPCADPHQVEHLKALVRSCIWKHVITASNMIPEDRPLVLVTWECRLRMSTVHQGVVRKFIKSHAMKGPEGTLAVDGQYTLKLREASKPPKGSNHYDQLLCPVVK